MDTERNVNGRLTPRIHRGIENFDNESQPMKRCTTILRIDPMILISRLAVIVLAVLALAQPAHAVRYELAEGEKYEVCRAYQENLQRFRDELPMVCERKLDPELKAFSKPDWIDLDPAKHMAILKEIWRVRSLHRIPKRKAGEPTWEESWEIEGRRRYLDRINNGELLLGVAKVDLLYDGKPDTVYRFSEYRCENKKELEQLAFEPFTYSYFIADPGDSRKLSSSNYWQLTNNYHGVFRYKNRPYLDSIRGLGIGRRAEEAAKGRKR